MLAVRERVKRPQHDRGGRPRAARPSSPALELQRSVGNRALARMFQPEDEEKQPVRAKIPLSTLAGSVHWLANLASRYKDMAGSGGPFAVAAKNVMEADLVVINRYITTVNEGGDTSELGVTRDAQVVAPKVRYTVNGRTYHTHDDSPQLFPVEGTDVDNGTGPIDMARVLQKRNLLTIERYLTLAQIWKGGATTPVKQMGKGVKTKLRSDFALATGNNPPPPAL